VNAAVRLPDDRPDTRELMCAHNVFRRLLGDLPWLVADVADLDVPRAELLAGVYAEAARALHRHNDAEDELLWPLLLARVEQDRCAVLCAEEQHERLHELCHRAAADARPFAATATQASREAFAATLGELFAVLTDHLDDEERAVLPLVPDHVSRAEWAALTARLDAGLDRDRAMVHLGWQLDGLSQAERRDVLAARPVATRLRWKLAGRRAWAAERARIYEH
jgi:hemerythrin-like domain-containing protein